MGRSDVAAITSTSTGDVVVSVSGVAENASADVTYTGSTKAVSAQLQGRIAGGSWFALSAASTLSTGAAAPVVFHSTVAAVFSEARVIVPVNGTTGNATITGRIAVAD